MSCAAVGRHHHHNVFAVGTKILQPKDKLPEDGSVLVLGRKCSREIVYSIDVDSRKTIKAIPAPASKVVFELLLSGISVRCPPESGFEATFLVQRIEKTTAKKKKARGWIGDWSNLISVH